MKKITRAKLISSSIFILMLPALSQARSNSSEWWRAIGIAPDRGLKIELNTPEGVTFKAGDTVKVTGEIKLNDAGSTPNSLLRDLLGKGIKLRVYFPDETSEIQNLSIDHHGKFSFVTAPLKSDDLNSVTATLTRATFNGRALEVLHAKLERRIAALWNLHRSLKDHKKSNEHALAKLVELIERLSAIAAKIQARLGLATEVLAKTTMPLLVDNNVPGRSYVSTLRGKFRFEIAATPGASSEGVSTSVTGTITNLRKAGADDHHVTDWKAKFYWNGGLSFAAPVDISFPNENELPAGTDVVIMSMNSAKGIWEINGVAQVADDGQSIKSKPGMGITHFSIVYPAPLGPKVSQIGSQDKPGADTFNGALSTSLMLPSFKAMGQSVVPMLTYKSSWANPTALVTTLFDAPRQDLTFVAGVGGGLGTLIRKEVTDTVHAWVRPQYVTAQLFSTGFQSDVVTFSGADGLPNKAALSFGAELKTKTDMGWEYMGSSVYPFTAHYEMHLKNMIIRTRVEKEYKWWGDPKVLQTTFDESRMIEDAFPSDLTGSLYVQNYVNSPAGRGWRIGGAQKIANTVGDRVMIEESDGNISVYAVNNVIQTLVDGNDPTLNLDLGHASDVSSWPNAYVIQKNGDDGRRAACPPQEFLTSLQQHGATIISVTTVVAIT